MKIVMIYWVQLLAVAVTISAGCSSSPEDSETAGEGGDFGGADFGVDPNVGFGGADASAGGSGATESPGGSDDQNSCEFARDGECDEPMLCDPGTDTHDCGGSGSGTGGSDDQNSCEFARDGECDEPMLCDPGTDTHDCGGSGSGTGQFRIEYGDPGEFTVIADAIQSDIVLEAYASQFNESYSLPYDILIIAQFCDMENAFWDPNARSITLCYDLVNHFMTSVFVVDGDDPNWIIGVVNFVMYHELGHALINTYSLPVLGGEEDAADGFATWSLVQRSDYNAIAAASEWFQRTGEVEIGESQFADEHSLNRQRFYNILCWIFGSDPDNFSRLVSEGYLPEARAVRCPEEWTNLNEVWNTLLQDHRP